MAEVIPLRGVGVALVTLFTDGLEVDVDATATHAERLVEAGVAGLVVAGSTGEALALSPEERLSLLSAVRERLGAGVPLLLGAGAAWSRPAAQLAARARDAGGDGALVLSPPRGAGLHGYYQRVADAAAGLPVLAYHFPAMSPPGIPVEDVATLPVAGLKDSSGDPERLLRERAALPGALYVGSSALLVQAGAIGCEGAILAAANAAPEGCLAAFAGDGDAQRDLLDTHLRGKASFPTGLKALMAERYGTSTAHRMGT